MERLSKKLLWRTSLKVAGSAAGRLLRAVLVSFRMATLMAYVFFLFDVVLLYLCGVYAMVQTVLTLTV